jgi:hypothetical protein
MEPYEEELISYSNCYLELRKRTQNAIDHLGSFLNNWNETLTHEAKIEIAESSFDDIKPILLETKEFQICFSILDKTCLIKFTILPSKEYGQLEWYYIDTNAGKDMHLIFSHTFNCKGDLIDCADKPLYMGVNLRFYLKEYLTKFIKKVDDISG